MILTDRLRASVFLVQRVTPEDESPREDLTFRVDSSF